MFIDCNAFFKYGDLVPLHYLKHQTSINLVSLFARNFASQAGIVSNFSILGKDSTSPSIWRETNLRLVISQV